MIKFMRDAMGFTLIEIVVTIAILLTALVGPVALVTRGLFNFSFAKDKLIALNLAQEGLELVRAVRENNVICDSLNGTTTPTSWNTNPSGGPMNGTYELAADDILSLNCKPLGGVTAIFISFPRPIPLADCDNPNPLTLTADGLYHYGAGTATAFSRCITVKACNPGPCVTTDPDIPASDQMEMASTVKWIERGSARSVTLQGRLYNWR